MAGSSCFSPREVVRFRPADSAGEVRWFYGNAYVKQERDSLSVEAAFLDADPAYLIFDLDIVNNSSATFLIEPGDIVLEHESGARFRAIEPEAHRLGMDLHHAREEARQKNLAVAAGAVAVVATVAAFATDGDFDGDNVEAADFQLALDFTPLIWSAAATATTDFRPLPPRDMPSPADRIFWTDHSLRRTHLRPGERVYGKVVFPLADLSGRYELRVPVAGYPFHFPFEKLSFQP